MPAKQRPAAPATPLTNTNTNSAAAVRAALRRLATPARAASSARYFKTGEGEYGAGDLFLGVDVPAQRRVAREHRGLPLDELAQLLDSRLHEERLTALFILVSRYQASRINEERRACFDFYLAHLIHVDNWDLVDSSAAQIVGAELLGRAARDRRLLDRMAASPSLWERRVAMIATYAFIRAGETADALRIAEKLLPDRHDLIHKAVGWMLREIGQRVALEPLRAFLTTHAPRMPRTTLRYAIEKLPPTERKLWLSLPRTPSDNLPP